MTKGIVMFYNTERGLGVISFGRDDNIIVAQSAIDKTQLREGDKVNFDIVQNNGSRCAENIRKNGSIFSNY